MLAGFFCGSRAWVTDAILCNLCRCKAKLYMHVRLLQSSPSKSYRLVQFIKLKIYRLVQF